MKTNRRLKFIHITVTIFQGQYAFYVDVFTFLSDKFIIITIILLEVEKGKYKKAVFRSRVYYRDPRESLLLLLL